MNLPTHSQLPNDRLEVQVANSILTINQNKPIVTKAFPSAKIIEAFPMRKFLAVKMEHPLFRADMKPFHFPRSLVPLSTSNVGLEIEARHLGGALIDQRMNVDLNRTPKVSSNNVAISGWLLVRSQASDQTIATAGQLGGSQVGTKVTTEIRPFGNSLHLNGFARVSSALTPVEAGEAAIGVSLRHSGRLVSEIQVERRIKLSKGGRNDFALVGSTSIYDLPITPLITLEGYAQAGVVGLKRRDLFIDASVRANKRLLKTGGSELSAGAGIWAAAQPDVSRIDIGPQITLKQHIGNGGFRISGEWRFRVAGNARPNSGPALTAGFDF